MAKSINRHVWQLLTSDEKLSLDLSLVHEKSSWKAGEIMEKAHYKYLEIQKRATYMIQRFTEYFRVTDNQLIPIDSRIGPEFQQYLRLTIGRRLSMRDTIKASQFEVLKKTKDRNDLITSEMKRLERSEKIGDIALYHMVKDFDKWNSYRILPPDLQEPSAYKRRNKHRNKKLIQLIYNMGPEKVAAIKKLYTATDRTNRNTLVWVTLLDMTDVKDVHIMPVSKKFIKNMTNIGLYAFKRKDSAEEFGTIMYNYLKESKKHCRDGQIFWPRFRKIIKEAVNADDINNIRPSRKIHGQTDNPQLYGTLTTD